MVTPVRTALIYDFDGTLAPGNIQEHSLIPEHLQLPVEEFWEAVDAEKRIHDADEILVYLRLLMAFAAERRVPLTQAVLAMHGAKTPFFAGVQAWFERINAYGRERGLALEHYVVSSGNAEMIAGSGIGHHFHTVFASRYRYDARGEAIWPAVAVNYTTKTQFLFRINKGVSNNWDNEPVNRFIPLHDRPMPFQRMIYFGDGDTDIPSMKMVRHQGGHSIAVFDPERWEANDPRIRETYKRKAYNLIAEDRAHFVVPADYRDGSQLDITVKGILGRICRDLGFRGDL
jgi:haloacid dehalogenase-like hydrolase